MWNSLGKSARRGWFDGNTLLRWQVEGIREDGNRLNNLIKLLKKVLKIPIPRIGENRKMVNNLIKLLKKLLNKVLRIPIPGILG